MALRRCDAGEHTYDDAQHIACPFCRKTRQPYPPYPAGVPADIPPPQPLPPSSPPGGTVKASENGPESNDGGKTYRVRPEGFSGSSGNQSHDVLPVVGWLIIVNGKGKGRDLRIVPGMNTIGREKGEIVLDFGDESISRENHARLAYNPKQDKFLLAHAESCNLTEINGETVMTSCELAPYDRILIGQTELIFVPLCGPNFSWKAPEDS